MKRTARIVKQDLLELLSDETPMTMERFRQGVPLLTEVDEKIRDFKLMLDEWKTHRENLCNRISDYADTHVKALDVPLTLDREGLRSGSVSIDGVIYRYTYSSNGGIERISGDNMSQIYLKGLPDDWVREKVELNTTALRPVSAEKLAQHDLRRKTKREWKREPKTE